MSIFRPASKHKSRLRMAIDGPSGSGKTFTSLRFAFALGNRIAVLNTESGAVEKYLGLSPDGVPWQFDIHEPCEYSPSTYAAIIREAGQAGYDVLIIDSLSHAWEGSGGALELVDQKGGNKYTAWKDVTPMHRNMIDSILRSPCHVIATMRSKTEYVLEDNAKGKKVPRKIGMAPIQRSGMDYEFDIMGSMDLAHILTISNTRCPDVDGAIAVKPGAEFILPVKQWLEEGSEPPEGYYTASEEDLRQHKQQQVAAAPKEPRKSARELMEEASKLTEEAASEMERTRDEQVARIGDLFNSLGATTEQRLAPLVKRGINTYLETSMEDATRIIVTLETMLDAKRTKEGSPF